MKLQLILIAVLHVASSIFTTCEGKGGYKEVITNCNSYIDSLLNDIKKDYGSYFDPHAINETVISFQKKVLFVNLTGEVKLTKGFIAGLKSLRRVSSCSLSLAGLRLRLNAKLETDPTFFDFIGSLRFMDMGPPVLSVHGNSSKIDMYMSLSLIITTGRQLMLEKFNISSMNDVFVRVEGLKLKWVKFDWVEEPLKKSFAEFFKASMKRLLEEEMKSLIETRMRLHPFSIEGYDIDFNEIIGVTTTTESIVEGKPVYSKQDSNSYIDGVLENRYLVESQYSKLDPYSIEDNSIRNAFLSLNRKHNFIRLDNGELLNLSKLKRIGDCSQPLSIGVNITFACNVGFDKLTMRHTATTYEDNGVPFEFELIPVITGTKLALKITTNVKDNVPALAEFSIIDMGKFVIKSAEVIAEHSVFHADNSFNQKLIIKHFYDSMKSILLGRFKDVVSYSVYKSPLHFLG